MDKANPLNPINRRISIVVLNKDTEASIMRESEAGATVYAPPGLAAGSSSAAPGKPAAQ
jgi:chemotaxis protein MotB